MKRAILTILICGVMVLGLTGCGKTKNGFDIGSKSDIQISEKDVSLSIKEGTLKNTGATLILENNSNTSIVYGNPYWIENEENEEWFKVKTINDLNFTLPEFGCYPNEKKEINIDWEYGYGKLSSGKYRIVKDVDFEYEDDTRKSFYVTAEFIIE